VILDGIIPGIFNIFRPGVGAYPRSEMDGVESGFYDFRLTGLGILRPILVYSFYCIYYEVKYDPGVGALISYKNY